jgi:NAD dependent epimerase/dehydratase
MDWQGRKALVTGAGGFIGSHLVEALAGRGARVRALVRYNSASARGWLDQLPETLGPQVEVVAGDIRDAGSVQAAVNGQEFVFHLAALISIPYSYEAPDSYVDTNVRGTLHVLEACRRHGVGRLVQTSTSEVYGSPETVPITEAHPLRAQSPYAATKVAGDKLAESYHCSFGLPVVVLRPFNTYGPRQSARAVLPTILSQLLAGNKTIELGALWPRRDLMYVEDTVDGFIKAAESEAAVGRTVHLGTGRDVSVGDLAELAMAVTGQRAHIVSKAERERPPDSEVRQLLSSPAAAKKLLGWAPTVSLEDGVRLTADWVKRNLASFDVGAYRR